MIRIGILGAGPNGQGNARKLAEHADRCSITAVADPNTEAAQALAAEFDGTRVFSSEGDLFPEVDAVVISSPNWLHPEQTIAAAGAGKHVWIEKPMALTVSDADRMVEAVDAAGVASMIGFSVRFDAKSQEMKRRLDAGEFGEWFSACSRRNVGFAEEQFAGWRGDPSRSGGVMSELIIHEIDWAVFLFGWPDSIYCRKRTRNPEQAGDRLANDHVWISLNYGRDRTVTIEGSQCAPIAEFYKSLIGTEASLHTRHWGQQLWRKTATSKDEQIETGPAFDKHGHWLDVIEGKTASVADVHYGRRITALIDLALESAGSGREIPL